MHRYVLLFARIIVFRYQHRAVFDEQLGPMGRAIFYWHVIPIGCFLLLPQRLQFFLFFVSPANSLETQSFGPWSGVQFYGQALIEEFHAADWSAGSWSRTDLSRRGGRCVLSRARSKLSE